MTGSTLNAAVVDRAVKAGYARGMYQHHDEIWRLATMLVAADVRVIVEIGMHRGGTAACFSEIAPDLVVSIDKPDGEWGGIGEAAADERDAGLIRDYPHWRAIRGDSHDTRTKEALVSLLDGRPIDFLFIDGDHSEAGVTADYLDYRHLVKRGGLIGFHDIATTDEHDRVGCQVDRLWHAIRKGTYGFNPTDDLTVAGLPWGGIGVVHA